MTSSRLDIISYELAYDFYHYLVKRNEAAMLNSEQVEAEAEKLACNNKHLFVTFARMRMDIDILLANIDFMISKESTDLDDEDKNIIKNIKCKYRPEKKDD